MVHSQGEKLPEVFQNFHIITQLFILPNISSKSTVLLNVKVIWNKCFKSIGNPNLKELIEKNNYGE